MRTGNELYEILVWLCLIGIVVVTAVKSNQTSVAAARTQACEAVCAPAKSWRLVNDCECICPERSLNLCAKGDE